MSCSPDKNITQLTETTVLADTDLLYIGKNATYDRKISGIDLRTTLFERGVSGGQTLVGGIDAGDNLFLDSTAHATKGEVVSLSDFRVKSGATSTLIIESTSLNKTGSIFHNDSAFHIGNNNGGTLELYTTDDTNSKFDFSNGTESILFSLNLSKSFDQSLLGLTDEAGNQLILTNIANIYKDHGFAAQTDPLLAVFSDTDLAVASDEWLNFVHNKVEGVISSGKGGIKLNPFSSIILNKSTIFSGSEAYSIAAETGVTSAMHTGNTFIRIIGDGEPIDITANPQIEAGVDGQFLIILGTSDTDTVTFENGDGLYMAASVVLGQGDFLIFIYDAVNSVWVMFGSDTK